MRRWEQLKKLPVDKKERDVVMSEVIAMAQARARAIKETEPKAIAKRVVARAKEWGGRVWHSFRNEHTIMNFLAPPEDEEALTEMQVVQIFWGTLMLELVLICVQYEGPEEPGEEQEPLPIVTILIAGIFTAGSTFACIFILRKFFKWGNNRRIPDKKPRGKRMQKVVDFMAESQAAQLYWHMKPELGKRVARSTGDSLLPRRCSQGRCHGGVSHKGVVNRLSSRVNTNSSPVAPRGFVRPPPSSPPPSPPAEGSSMPTVNSPPRSQPPVAVGVLVSTPTGTTPPQPASDVTPGHARLQKMRMAGIVGARLSKGGSVAASPHKGASLRDSKAVKRAILIGKLHAHARANEKLAKQAMRQASKDRRKYLRYRSKASYRCRSTIAWVLNLMVFVVCAGLSVIYGRLFGLQRTNDMILGWVTASATTWGAVEPLQVLMIATLPMLIKEDSPAGRCFERCRVFYNEFLA